MPFRLPLVPFCFLRHGVTDHNLRRLVMGSLDIPLNDQGRQQARKAALSLAQLQITRIFASPLSRARETAEIVGAHLGLAVEIVDDLRERDWGDMTGRPHRDLLRGHYATPPGGEPAEAFSARILSALDQAAPALRPDLGPALLVAHSGACRVLRRHLRIDDGEGPVPNGAPLLFAPTSAGDWTETRL